MKAWWWILLAALLFAGIVWYEHAVWVRCLTMSSPSQCQAWLFP